MNKFLVSILGLLILFLVFGCTTAENAPQSTTLKQNFSLSYNFTSEGTYRVIRINNYDLSYTYFPKESSDVKCRTWAVQMPCWSEADLVTLNSKLSDNDLNRLVKVITESGFLELENEEYNGRYYATTIIVSINGETKTIDYKSYPGAPAMPNAFTEVEGVIFPSLVLEKFGKIE